MEGSVAPDQWLPGLNGDEADDRAGALGDEHGVPRFVHRIERALHPSANGLRDGRRVPPGRDTLAEPVGK